jgi:hypothetical protein
MCWVKHKWMLPILAVLAILLHGVQAEAHNRSQSFSSWTISGDVLEVVFSVKAREVTRLPPLEGELKSLDHLLTSHLRNSISVRSETGLCQPQGEFSSLPAATGYVRARNTFFCAGGGERTLKIDSFFTLASSHVHYAKVTGGMPTPTQYLFTDQKRSQVVSRFGSEFDSFRYAFLQYVALGIEHIFDGLDHIVFLFALILILRRFRDFVKMVSGFTLGHSLTLSLAALGRVDPDTLVVEALIGFTIALVAAENLGALTRSSRQVSYAVAFVLAVLALIAMGLGHGLPLLVTVGLIIFTLAYLPLSENQRMAVTVRPFLTFIFGLIHGFGFAGVLNEVGLPEQNLVPALAGFNIGVEIAQLIIVVSFWYLARFLRGLNSKANLHMVTDMASSVVLGIGSYWFVVRSFS